MRRFVMRRVLSSLFFLLTVVALVGCQNMATPSQESIEISFITGTDAVIDSMTIKSGETITLPDAGTKEGFEFLGWYTGESVNNARVYDETQFYQSMSIYARWQEVTKIDVTRTVPIYQGMSISSTASKMKRKHAYSVGKIKDFIDVIPTEYVAFFANPNEEVLLTVNLLNPDKMVILRFTLNGITYQNYEFQEGSNSEQLILKVKAQSTSGVQSFTIDEIKYIDDADNNAIKDVIFSGEKTIKLGVTHQVTPSATITNQSATYNSFQLAVNTTNQNNLINWTLSPMRIFLFENETLIEHKPLVLGNQVIEFNNLMPNRTYQYIIAAGFDKLDGNGPTVHTLLTNDIATKNIISLDQVEITQNSISFDILELASDQVMIQGVYLFEDTTLKMSLDPASSYDIPGLDSNKTYEIRVHYAFGSTAINDVFNYTFTTYKKVAPNYTLLENTVTQTSISFTNELLDVDNTHIEMKQTLYSGSNFIKDIDSGATLVDGLLSNHTYTIKTTIKYNLSDGQGVQTSIFEHTFKTLEKSEPDVGLDYQVGATSLAYEVVFVDTDQVLMIDSVKVYQQTTLVDFQNNMTSSIFESLKANTEYMVRLSYHYDLNDGAGIQNKNIERTFITSKIAPTVDLNTLLIEDNAVQFEVVVKDINSTGQIDSIRLYKDGVLSSNLSNLSTRELTNLESNTLYILEVAYRYDLNDGNGAVIIKDQVEFQTLKEKPTISVNLTSNQNAINYNASIIDNDAAGSLIGIKLYNGNQLIETKSDLSGLFGQLLSNTTYRLSVSYAYDTNDGLGTKELVSDHLITTGIMPTPEVTLLTESTDLSIDYDFVTSDTTNSLNVLYAHLYLGTQLVQVGNLDDKTFVNLNPNTEYIIRYAFEYNLNDGFGNQTIVKDVNLFTSSATPKVTIVQTSISTSDVHFDLYVNDLNAVGQIYAIRLYRGEMIVSELTNLSSRVFTELDPNTSYQIRVTYVYDLNDGKGSQNAIFVNAFTTTKRLPTVDMVLGNITQDSVDFDLNITDLDNSGLIKSITVSNNSETTAESMTQRSFENLLSNNYYNLTATYEYDLNDGLGLRTIMVQKSFRTLSKAMPYGEINEISSTQHSILFDFIVNDIDQVGSLTSIELYLNGSKVQTALKLTDKVFNDLLSNNVYTVRLNYSYDLNDGLGSRNYVIERSIRTVSKAQPSIIIGTQLVDYHHVDYTYQIQDLDQVGYIGSIQLLQGQTVVEESLNFNVLSFSNLLTNTNYVIEIKYVYDLNDGLGEQTAIFTKSIQTKAKLAPSIDVRFPNITDASFTYDYAITDIDQVGQLSSVELFHGEDLLVTYTTYELKTINQLLSNNQYKLVFNYEYDLLDGLGVRTYSKEASLKTLAKQAPALYFDHLTVGYHGFDFVIKYDHEAQLVSIDKIELLFGGKLTKTIQYDGQAISIEGLLSNNAYQLVVYYQYDLNDGEGIQTDVFETMLNTNMYQTPTISFGDLGFTSSSIGYSLIENDIFELGSLVAVKLSQASIEIGSLSTLTGNFLELTPDLTFILSAEYQYDLNDGTGTHSVLIESEVYTLPFLDLISTDVINTTRLTEGDTIVLEIEVDNPSNIEFSRVLINGSYHAVSDVTTLNYIRIEFVLDDSYTGGVTTFTVERIEGYRGADLREFLVNENNQGEAFVNGDITVDSFEITDTNGSPVDVVTYGQTFQLRINLFNPSLYDIDYIKYYDQRNYSEITDEAVMMTEDKQTVIITLTSRSYNTTYSYDLREFSYSDDISSKVRVVSGHSDRVTAVIDLEPIMIYSADDLASIQNGKAYKLANDIYLTDIEWQPRDISYITLDGNGFTIYDLRIVKTVSDTHVHSGLFKSINESIVRNLNISNALIMLTLNVSTTSNQYEMVIGLLAATVGNSIVSNITLDGVISSNNTTKGNTKSGSLFGYAGLTNIDSVFASSIISTENDNANIGGLIGESQEIKLNKVFTTGKILGNANAVGGILAYGYRVELLNTASNMYLEGNSYIGGVIGDSYYSFISDSYYSGEISSNIDAIAGILYSGGSNEIHHSFTAATTIDNRNIDAVRGWGTIQSNVYNTYTDNYGATTLPKADIISAVSEVWDHNIWDFSGEFPQIQWVPHIRIANVIAEKTAASFDIYTTNFNQSNAQTTLQVFDGDTLINEMLVQKAVRITDLMYNTTYTVKVAYDYSYGGDYQTIEHIFNFTTLPAENTPVVDINIGNVYDTSLAFSYDYDDIYQYGSVQSIYITDETGQLVNSLSDLDLREITGLNPNQYYQLNIEVAYDLGDGLGIQTIIFSEPFRTTPAVTFNDVVILNQSAIITGDRLTLQINMDNSNLIEFTDVQINGVWYPVSSYNAQRLLVYVPIDSSMGVGEKTFEIEKIKGIYNARGFEFYINQNSSFNVVINGEIYVENVTFLSSANNDMEFVLRNVPFNVVINLYNPSNYRIDSITYSDGNNNYTTSNISSNIKQTEVVFSYTSSRTERQQITINSIQYSNEYVGNKSRNVQNQWYSLPIISSSDAILISTPEELQNMTSGGYYKLNNDIDLSSIEWAPIENFYGLLDGNGYTISNLVYIKSSVDESMYAGLFKNLNGAIIKNLTLIDFNFILSSATTVNGYHDIYAGLLAGQAEYSLFDNIRVDGIIEADNATNGQNVVGLLVGYFNQSSASNISIKGSATGQGSIAGFAGKANNSTIENTYVDATVIAKEEYAAVLIGHSENMILESIYVTGLVTNQNAYQTSSLFGYIGNVTMNNIVTDVYDKFGFQVYPYYNSSNVIATNGYTTATTGNGLFEVITSDAIPSIIASWDSDFWHVTLDRIALKNIPIIEFNQITPSIYGTTFDLRVADVDQVGNIESINLYQDGVLIDSLTDITLSTFEGLKYSTDYEIEVIYVYDYQDGTGIKEVITKAPFRTLDNENTPTIEITNVVTTTDTVSLTYNEIDTNNIGQIERVGLYTINGTLVEENTTDELTFSGLLSGTDYQVKLTYVFDYQDGFGPTYITLNRAVRTLDKVYPQIEGLYMSSGVDYVAFSFNENDPDQIGYYNGADLYDQNGVLVQTITKDEAKRFEGLYSNTYYNVVVSYMYDMNNGNGEQEARYSNSVHTQSIQVPSAYFEYIDIYQDAVSFKPMMNDMYGISNITKVEFYEGTTLKNSYTTGSEFNIESLLPNTTYKIKVTYIYNLNDQTGDKSGSYSYEFTTAPAFSVTSTALINQEAVMIGDYLVFNVGIDNPNSILINSVKINGRSYSISSQNADSFKVNVLIDELIGVGETTFMVEAVYGTYNGVNYTYDITGNNSDTKFINGDIRVIGLELLKLDGTQFEYGTTSANYVIVIKLHNPTGYDIDQVVISEFNQNTYNASQMTINADKTEVRIYSNIKTSSQRTVSIQQIGYSNDLITNKTKNISGFEKTFTVINDTVVREIRTVEELQAIESGYTYRLMNDIDLAGISWTPLNFSGVFDGNHYTISNLSMVKSYSEQTVYAGLFGTLSNAVVKDLTLDNVELYITLTGNSNYQSFVGGLAGYIVNQSSIENIRVTGNVIANNVTSGETFSGLLAGDIRFSSMDKVEAMGSVESKGIVGGLVGRSYYSNIGNASTNVQFQSTNNVYSGGLVGHIYYSTLLNSYAIGAMNRLDNNTFRAGSIAGDNNEGKIINVFAAVSTLNGSMLSLVYNTNSGIVNSFNMTTENRTEVLASIKPTWDESIWSFGITYPFIKHQPIVDFTNIVETTNSVSFDLSLIDHNAITTINTVELYKDGILVETSLTTDHHEFIGLRYSSDYLVRVSVSFDYLDENGIQTMVFEKALRTDDMENVPTVTYKNILVDKTSLSFSLDINSVVENSYLASIDLIDLNGDIVQTITQEPYRFDGLYSNTSYRIVSNYVYDFNDGFGANTLKSETNVKTTAKSIPSGNVIFDKTTDSSIEFSSTFNDPDSTIQSVTYTLLRDNNEVETITDLDVLTFVNLYSNKNYLIKMEITYNLNDNNGDVTDYTMYSFATLEKTTPSISLENMVVSTTSMAFDIGLTDPYGIAILSSVALYQNNQLISTIATENVSFDTLLPYTLYDVVVTYTYDKNDQNGTQTLVENYQIHTNPDFSLTSTTILNTAAIMVNDVMFLETSIVNPEGIVINQALINGVLYEVDYVSSTLIRIDVMVDNNFIGGETFITIEQLIGSKDGMDFYISPTENNQVTTFINGTIYVKDVRLLDENNNQLYFNQQYQTYFVEVEFYNPTGYEINRIDYRNEESTYSIDNNIFTLSAGNTIARFQLTSIAYYESRYQDYVNVTKFNYSNERITSRDRVVSTGPVYYSILMDETVISITTPEELQAIRPGYNYQLQNDIDLSGIEWNPIDNFWGSLDGNGYSISNLNMVRTYEDETLMLGLFKSITNATIKNLTLDNFNIIGTLNSYSGNTYGAYVGGLAGYIQNNSYIHNISLSGNITFSNKTGGGTYIGGLAGYVSSNNSIKNIIGDVTLESKVNNSRIGGLFGIISSKNTIEEVNVISTIKGFDYLGGLVGFIDGNNRFENAVLTTTISGSNIIGGLVGKSENDQFVDIYVQSNITGKEQLGGLIGHSYSSRLHKIATNTTISGQNDLGGLIGDGSNNLIENSYAVVDLTSTNSRIGGLIGNHYGSDSAISNSYAVGSSSSVNTYGITYNSQDYSVTNSYSFVTRPNSTFAPSLGYSNATLVQNVYSPVPSTNTQVKTIAEMIEAMRLLYDASIWDFDNPIDAYGNPSLK